MLTGTELASDERAENKGRRISGRTLAKLWAAAGLAGMPFVGAWLKYSPGASGSSAGASPAALPQVVVSKPLAQDIDTRLGSTNGGTLFNADSQLLVARNDVESTRADAARAAVRTFRALGGGWDIRSNPSLTAVK
jgi:hypothetical protein